MKTAVVSYSFTGNNHKLASMIASSIKADHISITDKREISVKTIMLDLIFHRKAKNNESQDVIKNYDFIIYVAPFWVGKIARPLIPFFKLQRNLQKKYAFVTISGGSLGKNTKYKKELQKRIKMGPEFCNEFYIVDLIKDSEVNVKESSSYRINDKEVENMVIKVVENYNKIKF